LLIQVTKVDVGQEDRNHESWRKQGGRPQVRGTRLASPGRLSGKDILGPNPFVGAHVCPQDILRRRAPDRQAQGPCGRKPRCVLWSRVGALGNRENLLSVLSGTAQVKLASAA